MDHAHRGEAAVTAKNFPEAITHYTAAIAASPTAATYYIKRSTAYQRSQQYGAALADADVAVTLAIKRAKRELIAQAQLRRGIALFHLRRYGDARACFGWAERLDAKDKLIGIWRGQVEGKLRGVGDGDELGRVVVMENPGVDVAASSSASASPAAATEAADEAKATNGASVASSTPATSAAPSAQTPANKIRHEWYQNTENVYVTLLAKGVPKEQAAIEIERHAISISFPLVTGSSFDFSLDPLYAPVNTEASSYKVLSTKIEIVLKKSTPGQKWPALEGTSKADGAAPTSPDGKAESAATLSAEASSTKQSAPSYPTSSRTGPKNWDKIASSYSKPPTSNTADSKSKSATEKPEGPNSKSENDDDIYVDDDDEGGDEVNAFFKKLYAGASDETKRAMMKSYQESGGTALSTNWDEVSKGPVPVSPPDGMEEKKWAS